MRLVDLALSSAGSEDHLVVVPPPGDGARTDRLPTALVYDHFAVCQTLDGLPWELGRGAMGITYKARDTNLNRLVALKIINSRLVTGASGRERFLREARAAAKLHHPNIAGVFHLGVEDKDCFYAMEYIAGETLEAQVRRFGPLNPATALEIIIQIAEALCHAHAERLIHRDIKPSNIMFARAGSGVKDVKPVVKLIDFGLVKAWTDAADTTADATLCRGYFAGTPCYASPEQLSRGRVDARSDIFALGQCWWYMLTGRHPATVTRPVGLVPIHSVSHPEKARTIRDLPIPMRQLLDSMAAFHPTQRPPDAAALVARLRKCQLSLAPRRPHRKQAVVSAALLGLLAASSIGFYAMSKFYHRPAADAAAVSLAERLTSARALYGEAEELRFRFTKKDNEHAARLYSQAIANAPEFGDAYAGLAITQYQAVGRFGEPTENLDLAADTAERAIHFDPKSPKGFHALASIRLVQGRPWQALKIFRHALELDPKYLPAMRDFSLAWSWVGKPQYGLVWARAAAQMEPSNLVAWGAAAEASVELADDEEAEKFYRRCVQIEPGWIEGYCGLIRIHLLRQDFAQARQDCTLAASLSSPSIFLQTLEAQVFLLSGDYSQAEGAYRKLLQANRNGMVNYHGGISYLSALGYLCLREGKAVEGNAFLEEAAHLHVGGAEGPQAIYDLAAIRSIQGRQEEALSLLKQAIDSGWMDYRVTRLDPRFAAIQPLPSFGQMLDKLCGHVAQMRQVAETLSVRPLSLADYPVEPSAE